MSPLDTQISDDEVGTRPSAASEMRVVRAVTTIMGVVVGLTFLFGFGNVLTLALRLGVPVWVAPLVAPAVDLSILGLLLAIRHLVLSGCAAAHLQPARRLLIFASLVTLALNIADPMIAGQYGKAAFDAVGPLLLIGWAEVGPGILQALAASGLPAAASTRAVPGSYRQGFAPTIKHDTNDAGSGTAGTRHPNSTVPNGRACDDLLATARQEDAHHWREHQRPISAETLRKRLGIGAARSRSLVSIVRAGTVEAGHARDDPRVVRTGSALLREPCKGAAVTVEPTAEENMDVR